MYHFGNLSTLYPISLPMQSTLGVVSKYGMMLSCGSFGHFLSNSQASWDEKHCDYFSLQKRSLKFRKTIYISNAPGIADSYSIYRRKYVRDEERWSGGFRCDMNVARVVYVPILT